MKNLLILLILISIQFTAIGQTFTYNFIHQGEIKLVEVNLDTSFTQNVIRALKSFMESGTSIINQDANDLVLVGDFDVDELGIVLDYSSYNYYFIPFHPTAPFQHLNKGLASQNVTGHFYIGTDVDHEAIDPEKDKIYWCSCNGDHSTTPGGCVSTLETNGDRRFSRCVSDTGCSNSCIGTTLTGMQIINGGGILVQVSISKSTFFHNLNTW